jgi:2'-5' RNA ligase superfamily
VAESSFIARVPEAEPYVAHLREQFDPAARLGVPAHVTPLYPVMSPELIETAVVERVRAVVAATRSFVFTLARVCRFPDVLYIAPEPSGPFVELTEHLVYHFPEFPPYGGQYDGIVPHLTVAHGSQLEHSRAETELQAALSGGGGIVCSCRELVLIENASGRWQQMHVFPLASVAHAAG